MIDYDKILKELKSAGDTEYKKFNESLIPGEKGSFGVRVPYLRKMAQGIAKGDWQDFLKVATTDTYEERLLQGYVIGYAKCNLETRLSYLEDFVPKINSWAVCDGVCAGLKAVKKDLPRFLEFLQPYMKSIQEFELRFALVCLMDYYINDEYIDMTLEFMAGTDFDAYYVKMAAAWGLSVCFVKYREKTMNYFTEEKIADSWINNKAIQKIRESYRVSDADKKLLLDFKRPS
ncbi:MAG: DNA alkylation repair protein [Ruminococcaceae bacterium]|nr:DNA alkylation repair protein [Oscillospiraceae bacterium]